MKEDLICVTGVTASGKSQLAIQLAKRYPIEIVSMDSAMVYRHLDIGTAKPIESELQDIPHHLIDIINPKDLYSVGQFLEDANQAISSIMQRGNMPLIVGGTLMYLNAIYKGLAILPKGNHQLRHWIDKLGDEYSWEILHELLAFIDPDAVRNIDVNDRQRVERLIEIFLLTRKTPSSFFNSSINYFDRFNIKTIALVREDKSNHYQLIKTRINDMVNNGFIDEVIGLRDIHGLTRQHAAMKLIGYRQINQYLDGDCSLDEALTLILHATNQFTKRQMTWLRKLSFINYATSSTTDAFKYMTNHFNHNAANKSYAKI
jgi:tRNA dimethylallyltransferase